MQFKSIIRNTLGVKRHWGKEIIFHAGHVMIQLDVRKGWAKKSRSIPIIPKVPQGFGMKAIPLVPSQGPIHGGAHLDTVRLVQAASLAAGGQVGWSALNCHNDNGPPSGALMTGTPANEAGVQHRHR